MREPIEWTISITGDLFESEYRHIKFRELLVGDAIKTTDGAVFRRVDGRKNKSCWKKELVTNELVRWLEKI